MTTEPPTTTTWHTRNWYKEHFGVDPAKHKLAFKSVPNPYYSSAGAPMRLWDEQIVLPFKSPRGIEQFQKHSKAGLKGAATRKKNLTELFSYFKNNDPAVQTILKRLWEIHNEIGELHNRKADHREFEDSSEFFEWGVEHCSQCGTWSLQQDGFRNERAALFMSLEEISGMDKQAIQLGRRYLREAGEELK